MVQIRVVVPEGAQPGQKVRVKLPGSIAQVKIPKNAMPGDTFQVSVTDDKTVKKLSDAKELTVEAAAPAPPSYLDSWSDAWVLSCATILSLLALTIGFLAGAIYATLRMDDLLEASDY